MKSILLIILCIMIASLSANIIMLESVPHPEYSEEHMTKQPMTPEEMLLLPALREEARRARTFPTNPILRPHAEFDRSSGALIRFPLGIPIELVRELANEIRVVTVVSSAQQNAATTAFTNAGVNMDNVQFLVAPNEAFWTRDYGAFFAYDETGELIAIDFNYNRPNRPNDNRINAVYAVFDTLRIYHMGILHEGGNYMTDGLYIGASTDLVYTSNNNDNILVDERMNTHLGIVDYHVMPCPLLPLYIQHIDCWGKFLSPDRVLIRSVPQNHANYQALEDAAEYFESVISAWGTLFTVFRVETPNDQPYTNSLILNNRVFVPVMGGASSVFDEMALQVYADAMPGYTIIGVPNNTNNPWIGSDGLHCRVKELAERRIVDINHMPLARQLDFHHQIEIIANIRPLPWLYLIPDSVNVFYRINGGEFQSQKMTLKGTRNNEYSAFITGLSPRDVIEYYIRAVDETFRYANHPFIGAPMAHRSVLLADTTPPHITHAPLTEPNPTEITAHVTDNYGVSVVYIEMTSDPNGDEIEIFEMEHIGEDIYRYILIITASDDIVTKYYRFRAIDLASPANVAALPRNGWFSYGVIVSEDDETVPTSPLQVSVFPNPLNVSNENVLKINVSNSSSNNVSLALYNIRGQRIANADFTVVKNEINTINWDINSLNLSSGIYFLRYNDAENSLTQRVMVIK